MLVELMGRYSNIPELPKLDQITPVQRAITSSPRVHNAEKRLGLKKVAELIAAYEAGSPTTELMITYNLGKGTVLRLLRDHGVQLRNQSLTADQVGEAIRLYLHGWSLAKVGRQFGRDHTVIRDALERAGIPRRDSHGLPRQ